ncbi:hypothetical protein O9H85_19200 [Paenibacillus filicis]|uniref:Uncharacterized protein n=1 Tax=Paenibacillus gyeongsangnamensis TaxID=3388067 RepID=A0ABT4QC86_9BACL|nr:hypothetical protein [Paenibacillus filicis]MCZ8514509.1 hypothetical protein [Paenibacillus filicis]
MKRITKEQAAYGQERGPEHHGSEEQGAGQPQERAERAYPYETAKEEPYAMEGMQEAGQALNPCPAPGTPPQAASKPMFVQSAVAVYYDASGKPHVQAGRLHRGSRFIMRFTRHRPPNIPST